MVSRTSCEIPGVAFTVNLVTGVKDDDVIKIRKFLENSKTVKMWTYVLERNQRGTDHMHGCVITDTPVGKVGQNLWNALGPPSDGSVKKHAVKPKTLYKGPGWAEYCAKEGTPVRSNNFDEELFKKAGAPDIPLAERRSSQISLELRSLDDALESSALEWNGTYEDLVRIYNTMMWKLRVISFVKDPRQKAYTVQAWYLWRTQYTGTQTAWKDIKGEEKERKRRADPIWQLAQMHKHRRR